MEVLSLKLNNCCFKFSIIVISVMFLISFFLWDKLIIIFKAKQTINKPFLFIGSFNKKFYKRTIKSNLIPFLT